MKGKMSSSYSRMLLNASILQSDVKGETFYFFQIWNSDVRLLTEKYSKVLQLGNRIF
jgi:hypothetical protein